MNQIPWIPVELLTPYNKICAPLTALKPEDKWALQTGPQLWPGWGPVCYARSWRAALNWEGTALACCSLRVGRWWWLQAASSVQYLFKVQHSKPLWRYCVRQNKESQKSSGQTKSMSEYGSRIKILGAMLTYTRWESGQSCLVLPLFSLKARYSPACSSLEDCHNWDGIFCIMT